ncbi:MAG TPA: SCO family protein [Pyrinomonadaceae bacterium]|nr:SCO family protein [Pyrinomonadaceae bacterium]
MAQPCASNRSSASGLKVITFLQVLLLLPLVAGAMTLQSPNDHHHQPATAAAEENSTDLRTDQFKDKIPNFVLRDQSGKNVRFYSDLIKGKIILLSFFFTECRAVCDAQGRNLAKLQTLLGKRLGRDVFIISVTRTPETDTSTNLSAWARRFSVKPGWTLVTGNRPDIARLVGTFANDSLGSQEMHSSPILIGNDKTGSWFISSGLSAPDRLLELIGRVTDRQTKKVSAENQQLPRAHRDHSR